MTTTVDGVEVRPVPGFDNYSIAEDGRFYSHPREVRTVIRDYTETTRRTKGRWLKPLFKQGDHGDAVQCQELCVEGKSIHVNTRKVLKEVWS